MRLDRAVRHDPNGDADSAANPPPADAGKVVQRATANVALLGPGHQIIGYLNLTPNQGAETLANYAHFRVDHNGDEGDSAIRTLASVTNRRFGSGHISCVQDSYATKSAARYVELACLISGRMTVALVGAAPPQYWPRISPQLKRAISTATT